MHETEYITCDISNFQQSAKHINRIGISIGIYDVRQLKKHINLHTWIIQNAFHSRQNYCYVQCSLQFILNVISVSFFPHHKYVCSLFINVLNEILQNEHMFRLISMKKKKKGKIQTSSKGLTTSKGPTNTVAIPSIVDNNNNNDENKTHIYF